MSIIRPWDEVLIGFRVWGGRPYSLGRRAALVIPWESGSRPIPADFDIPTNTSPVLVTGPMYG